MTPNRLLKSAIFLKRLWLLVFVIGLAGAPAAAQTEAVTLAPADTADIARIEDYLNDIGTLESRFVQFTAAGVAEGQIYMSRPGDMRIEYDPPRSEEHTSELQSH